MRVFTFILILILLFPVVSSSNPDNVIQVNLKPILQPGEHSPILITSDTGFNSTNGVSKGNGTAGNPYVFENLLINASSSIGIDIKDTTSHFTIKNCTIDGGTSDIYNGMELNNVQNFIITNITIINCSFGITGRYLKNMSLNYSTIKDNPGSGIELDEPNFNITVSDCMIINNSYFGTRWGIKINGEEVEIRDCEVSFCHTGIGAGGAGNGSLVINNKISDCYTMISWVGGTVELRNNICWNSTWGLKGWRNENEKLIMKNNIFENGQIGARIRNGEYVIKGNSFQNFTSQGIEILPSDFNATVENNSFINCGSYGIKPRMGRYYSNKMVNCSFDMSIASNNGMIECPPNNTVNDKPVYFFSDMNITNLTIPQDAGQLIFLNCTNGTIRDLGFDGGGIGIQIIDSSEIYLSNITMENMTNSGFIIDNTIKPAMTKLTCKNCNIGLLAKGDYWGPTLDLRIDENNFINCSTGLRLIKTSGAQIIGSSFIECEIGASSYGKEIDFLNSTFSKCGIGVNITGENYHFQNVKIVNCSKNGMEGYDDLYNSPPEYTSISINNCTISNNSGDGIHVDNIANISIVDSNIRKNNGFGCWMKAVDDGMIVNCSFDDNGRTGLHMETGKMQHVLSNQFKNNTGNGVEISLQDPPLLFTDNNCSSNEISGARLQGPIEVFLNKFENNTQMGLEVLGDVFCKNNSIHNNTVGILLNGEENYLFDNWIIDNNIGIEVQNATENLIFNNYFNNENTCKLDGTESQNEWNLDVPLYSKNVIYGPVIWGNYWSDYDGVDISGDLCGDTNVPHGPGDSHPLIKIPTEIILIDETEKNGYSGIDHYINISVSTPSPGNLRTAYINATRFGRYETDNIAQRISTFDYPTNLVMMIDTPDWCSRIEYRCDINDEFGNNASLNGTIYVENYYPPRIISINPDTLINGKTCAVEVTIEEEYGMDQVILFKEDYPPDISLVEYLPISHHRDNNYTIFKFEVDIGESIQEVRFKVNAIDTKERFISKTGDWIEVEDRSPPEVEFKGYDPNIRNGSTIVEFKIWDNREVLNAFLDASFPGYNYSRYIPLEMIAPNSYHVSISLPSFCTSMILNVEAFDTFYNEKIETFIVNLPFDHDQLVQDRTVGDPVTGNEFDINFWINQSFNLEKIYLSRRFDTDMEGETMNSWRLHIDEVPIDSRILFYQISLLDGFGKWINLSFRRDVIDTIPPNIEFIHDTPINSEMFNLSLDIIENREIVDTRVLYDVGWGWTFWNPVIDNQYTLLIPDPSSQILIYCSVTDDSGSLAEEELLLNVEDRIPPGVLYDISFVSYSGGRPLLNLDIRVKDNREIGRVNCLWEYDDGSTGNLSLTSISNQYFRGMFEINDGIEKIVYRIEVTDSSGNHFISSERELEIDVKNDDPSMNLIDILRIIIPLMLVASGIFIVVFLFSRRRSYSWEE